MMPFQRVLPFAALVLALGAGAAPAAAQAQGSKIAFIDSRLVLRGTPGYAQAESLFTREVDGYRIEVQRLQATLDSAAQDFERQSVVLSPSAREAKRNELQQQQAQLERRANELQERAANRERELLSPIQQRVNAAIERLREQGGYAAIFDVGAPGAGIITIDRTLDLTQRVIDAVSASGN